MNFDGEFKIIAKKELSVIEGLDYPLGRGNFGKAFLVTEKNGPWNNRLVLSKLIRLGFIPV